MSVRISSKIRLTITLLPMIDWFCPVRRVVIGCALAVIVGAPESQPGSVNNTLLVLFRIPGHNLVNHKSNSRSLFTCTKRCVLRLRYSDRMHHQYGARSTLAFRVAADRQPRHEFNLYLRCPLFHSVVIFCAIPRCIFRQTRVFLSPIKTNHPCACPTVYFPFFSSSIHREVSPHSRIGSDSAEWKSLLSFVLYHLWHVGSPLARGFAVLT